MHLSGNAHLIMPWHVAIDQASERRLGKLQIGTTRRGIGPAYADKAARHRDPRAGPARPEDPARRRSRSRSPRRTSGSSASTASSRSSSTRSRRGYERLRAAAAAVRRRHVAARRPGARRPASSCSSRARRATLLDLDHGTYPFVTSSNPVAGGRRGRASGSGRTGSTRSSASSKAYVTRVGEGPFPTRDRGARPGARPRARQRVRHGDRPRAPLRLARPRRAALRRAA